MARYEKKNTEKNYHSMAAKPGHIHQTQRETPKIPQKLLQPDQYWGFTRV